MHSWVERNSAEVAGYDMQGDNMKIQILWNIKDGTYPHFMKARPEMNDNPVYKGKVFPLNKEIVLLMKEKNVIIFLCSKVFLVVGFLQKKNIIN